MPLTAFLATALVASISESERGGFVCRVAGRHSNFGAQKFDSCSVVIIQLSISKCAANRKWTRVSAILSTPENPVKCGVSPEE
jgi:hypothetical protein